MGIPKGWGGTVATMLQKHDVDPMVWPSVLQIRELDMNSGTIKTVMGTGSFSDLGTGDNGPATQATVRAPTGLTVAYNGEVYFSTW